MTPPGSMIAVILGVAAMGCQPSRSVQTISRSEPPAMNLPPSCRVILTPALDQEYNVRFLLSNPTTHAISLDTYEPFLQFQVRAAAGDAVVPIEQPTLDIPVQPKTISIAASGTVEIDTPVRLRFRVGAPQSQDRFVWSIIHASKGVQLTFSLDLPPPFDQSFVAHL